MVEWLCNFLGYNLGDRVVSKYLKVIDGQITIDIADFLEALTKEEQLQIVKQLAVQDYVLEKAIDYICGDDTDGWWTSNDDTLRMKLLDRIESAQLSKWSKYNWQFITEATQRLKEIREKQHIYWALHHGPFRDDLSQAWFKFCKANNIVSEYTTEKANADIENVIKIVENAIKNCLNQEPEKLGE